MNYFKSGVSFNKIYTLDYLFYTNNVLGGEHHVFQKLGRTRGGVVLAEPQVKLQLLQAGTLLGVSGQTHFQEILAIWRERQKTATVMHQNVNYKMNWFAYKCVFLTFRQLVADFQLISKELCGLKSCMSVEQFKQDHSQLPHCVGASPVGTTTQPHVIRGA